MVINNLKIILLAGGIGFFSACNSVDKNNADTNGKPINPEVVNNPATASSEKKQQDHVPVFQFTEEEHDFGTIHEGEKVSFAFKFKNSGDGDLVIRSASGSCGCT